MSSARVLAVAILAACLLVAAPALAGYTHYWTWHAPTEPAALATALEEMAKIAAVRSAILEDREGRTGSAAVFLGTCTDVDAGEMPCIVFNGIGKLAHEQFAFPLAGDPKFSFVKTMLKPYDDVAVACLLVARDHFPKEVLSIASDGNWGEEWSPGASLYEAVTGRAAHNPLDDGVLEDSTLPGFGWLVLRV